MSSNDNHDELTEFYLSPRDAAVRRSGVPAFRRLVMSNTIFADGCNGGCGIVMMSWLGRQVAQKTFGSAVQPEATQ